MVRDIKAKYAHTDPHSFKVLILSCSTLHKDWGGFATILEKKQHEYDTTNTPGAPYSYTIFNAAGIGFSSRDNLNCYRLLSDLQFDLVVDYSGINDARFNNCPKEIYREDYGQIPWGNETNCILRHTEMKYTIIPFFLDFTYCLLSQSLFKNHFIPIHYSMRPAWWDFGSDLKSLKAFKYNIESIENLSKEKKEKLLLTPYCYYIPSNYTLKRFKDKQLDYTFQHNSREIEIWGFPKNVSAFLDSANIIVGNIATTSGSQYLDIRPEVQNNGNYFADVCHFSPAGLSVFAGSVSQEIVKIRKDH
jgi:hypothetical protein